jgi:prefoldin subunit 5
LEEQEKQYQEEILSVQSRIDELNKTIESYQIDELKKTV